MIITRVIGFLLTLAGLSYYGWHLLTGAGPFHPLQIFIGGVLCIVGLSFWPWLKTNPFRMGKQEDAL